MKTKLPVGYQARPARMDDLEDVVKLFNEWSRHIIGVEKFELEDNRREWLTKGFDMDTDTQVVLTPQGKIVGYYDVWDVSYPHVLVFCWGRVHPGFQDMGIESYLLEWTEQRARQAILKAPPEALVAMQCATLSLDELAQARYRQTGLSLVRHYLRMVIDLNGAPPQPYWPGGVTVSCMAPGQDQRPVFQAVHDAFIDHWGHVERPFEEELERWNQRIEDNPDYDPSLFFLAMDGGEIAGVSLCWPKVDDDPEMGWVGTLGVRRPWRRRGLGLALLQHSFRQLHQHGLRKVGLGVDAHSLTGATRLYEKAGMHSDPARQLSLYEKELRPGVDLRTVEAEEKVNSNQ